MNKITENCIVKILPIIDDRNNQKFIIPVDRLWLESTKKFIYEVGEETMLRQLVYPEGRIRDKGLAGSFSRRYLVNILEQGKIRTVSLSKSLMNLVIKNASLLSNLNSDYHINVIVEAKYVAGRVVELPSFDKSSIMLKSDWIIPVSDVNSDEEWTAWIEANQDNNYLRYIERDSTLNNRELLDTIFDGNLSKIIADKRDKRISNILSE